MIHIITSKTNEACRIHQIEFTVILKNRIAKYAKGPMASYLLLNLDSILVSLPEKLLLVERDFNKKFIQKLSTKKKAEVNKKLKSIFNYDDFIKKNRYNLNQYNAYTLADNLKVDVCPYCNRMYTITITGKHKDEQLVRPEFDHYFTQSSHPILGLSFYNLIPSCHVCNSNIKGKKELSVDTHIHPYLDNIIDKVHFDYRYSGDKIVIFHTIDRDNLILYRKIENTLSFFKIDQLYTGHHQIVKDIIELKQEYSRDYLQILIDNFPSIGSRPDTLYKLAFGTLHDDKLLGNYPFSKLKKDILEKEVMLEALSL